MTAHGTSEATLRAGYGLRSPKVLTEIQALLVEQIEDLGEALLDFSTTADPETWFSQH
ncbi:DUF4351 domain-containing protein [Synechococcus elongatus FACHB-1061]|nr:DUF4351 domain-containing protein [Synechococcus elongatus FACHB-242]MBD2690133.1 DUF4351 domain-containing protein [Synechococcus elongatus FACHB-1061]MBD2708573.1 DUF4351 domain-containing protein [Synechococcus elongatus PCC 7942 = FACHB-805]